jgi:trans-2,3-dihydro-3-hydroxyanthranilate isomerase
MNYSESVFVTPPDVGADAKLSIYTPAAELPFAGHPVLGAAAVIAGADGGDLLLGTRIGPVAVEVRSAGPSRCEVWMQQPWPESFPGDVELLGRAVGTAEPLAASGYDNGARYALVELASREDVSALSPDLGAISRLGHGVLCFAGEGTSWKARMFAPAIGVSEDPATGSAAGPLAVHLYTSGRLAAGETIEIEQGAEIGRPSLLRAIVETAAGSEPKVRVGGHVVIVAQGTFSLRPEDVDWR